MQLPNQEELAKLEDQIRRLKTQFDLFFMGVRKLPPSTDKKQVEEAIRDMGKGRLRDNTSRFRYNTLVARYNRYQELWGRQMREREEGPIDFRKRQAAMDALIRWFARERAHDADEFYIGGSMQPLPGGIVTRHGLGRTKIETPCYWVDLDRLAASDGELYPVLSSNARQQLRRAMRYFERFGQPRLERATSKPDADTFRQEVP